MLIDCHVHTCSFTPAHGLTSPKLLSTLPFRFMRWRLKIKGNDATTEHHLNQYLFSLLDQTPELHAISLLAFDAVYTEDGLLDQTNTHLYVTNDHAHALSTQHPKILFTCSVHPYRKDALAELERCIAMGAVSMKWLPLTQNFDPSDERCYPLYDCLAHHKIPLLSHTGGESTLPNLAPHTADPALLEPALQRNVTVIAAHCGTKSTPWEPDHLPTFIRLAKTYPNLYGDTSALNLPTRWYAYEKLLPDPTLRAKLIHGSDWPILPTPNPRRLGTAEALHHLTNPNWLQRDIHIKQRLGFDNAYWTRAATLLRLPARDKQQHGGT